MTEKIKQRFLEALKKNRFLNKNQKIKFFKDVVVLDISNDIALIYIDMLQAKSEAEIDVCLDQLNDIQMRISTDLDIMNDKLDRLPEIRAQEKRNKQEEVLRKKEEARLNKIITNL